MPTSRRSFLTGAATAAFATGTLPFATAVRATTPAAVPALLPLAQIKLNRFTITALSDGYSDLPYSMFPGRTPEQVEAAAKAVFAARPEGIRFMINQYLIEDGEHRVLIDTGSAGTIGKSGELPNALDAIGVSADSVDAVIITHMHEDHIGGLVAGGQRGFANAELYIDRREFAHWTDPAKQAAAPDYLQESFRLSAETARLYPKLQAVDGEREIVKGVSIVDLAGHTPGHIGVRIEDGDRSLVMVSDMLFPVVHPAATDVNFVFEQDRPAAQAMRARFFPRAADEGTLVAATHLPFPGLGRIISDKGTFRWLPAEWAYL